MPSIFQSNLRTKSPEQLLNMVANRNSWSDEQFQFILLEIENRGITTVETDELAPELAKKKVDEGYQSEFDNDLEFITEAELKEVERDRLQLMALVVGLSFTVLMAFTLFGGFSMLGVENQYTDAYIYVFMEYLVLIILWFFLVWGLFIGKKCLLSIIASAGLGLFLIIMSWINS